MAGITKIKGFADLFGPQARVMRHLEDTARNVFARYGYLEARVPILERTDLFARSIGEETDVVAKEMYTFGDRKNRSLTLRPEATAGIVRAYVENKLHAQERVAKYYTFGPMFRYERPQKGRMRQFHQIDAECLGPDEPLVDAELIIMLWNFLAEAGIIELGLELNTLGCAECRPGYHQALADFFKTIDQDQLCEDCKRRVNSNPLRVLDCKVPQCKELTQAAPTILESCCEPCSEHFSQVRQFMENAQIPYIVNHRLVRGLDYYTRTTFEVVSGKIGSQSAVAGGGRYDKLVKQLGGPDTPAIGFAIGMERLCLLLPEMEQSKPDFFIAMLDEDSLPASLQLAESLRKAGLTGISSFSASSLKSQMRQANKSGANACLLLSKDDLSRDELQLKNMTSGEQGTVSSTDTATLVSRILSFAQALPR